jgi:hypothetical protein
MEIIAIALARVAALVEVQQWDPLGKASSLEAVAKLGSRFRFTRVPMKLEELNLQKGLELCEGTIGDIRIDRLTIFANGIVIDTRSSTEDSEKVLSEILAVANEAFGAKIAPARLTFTSQLIFRSNMQLAALNPILPKLAGILTDRVSGDLKHAFEFQPTAILLNVDTSQAKTLPAMFSIERRAEVPFVENTFFSNAPLRTREHLELVRAFEDSLIG